MKTSRKFATSPDILISCKGKKFRRLYCNFKPWADTLEAPKILGCVFETLPRRRLHSEVFRSTCNSGQSSTKIAKRWSWSWRFSNCLYSGCNTVRRRECKTIWNRAKQEEGEKIIVESIPSCLIHVSFVQVLLMKNSANQIRSPSRWA